MIEVDLRTIVGTPRGNNPIMVACPCHEDPAASLGVYSDHVYCFATRRFFRRYESAALLLGLWNGRPETVEQAVKMVRPKLSSIQVQRPIQVSSAVPKPIDKHLADTFHRYLLSSSEALAFFKSWRGLTEETIAEFNLGWTGSHFTIPVPGDSRGGPLYGIRFREDPRVPTDGPKYSGFSGRNARRLYSMRCLVDLERAGSVWVFEGEYDSQVGWQLGLPSVTMTNGSGSLLELPTLLKDVGLKPARYVIATDQDEAGEQAAWELCKQLGSAAVRARWDSSYKDISAFHVAGGTVQDIHLTGQQDYGTLAL